MKHANRIATIQGFQALMEVRRHEELFLKQTYRQEFPNTPHQDTETIFLRMQPGLPEDPVNYGEEQYVFDVVNSLEAEDTEDYANFPIVRNHVMNLMSLVAGERLGRVMIIKLKAGGQILPHEDQGVYPDYYDRFHIILEGQSKWVIGPEGEEDRFIMNPDEVYWVNNSVTHSVLAPRPNADRIAIVIDIKVKGDKKCRM
jgi:mannose-6-phosphate isomerase-like protein (cupin superfamily)